MSKPFNELRERLLQAGIAPRHVRRYLRELNDHLTDLRAEEERVGRTGAEAQSIALARLGSIDDLAKAMIDQCQLRSWSWRAPWAVFGILPISALTFAYFVACFILWSGWKLFMPGVETPFGSNVLGPIYGLENVYFQTGRMIYFGGPILIGWTIGVVAARQRLKAAWPASGFMIIATIASIARVDAIRQAHGAAEHVSMTFALDPVHGIYYLLVRSLVLFSLAAFPYFIWRLHTACSRVLG